jgi:hypothetical protein
MRNAHTVVIAALLMLLSGCASETIFQSNFDATPIGQPPAAAQAVGTGAVDGAPGSVVVIAPPVQPSGHWLQVSRPSGPAVSGFQGKFADMAGPGTYTFTATMFMPANAQTATVQFEPFGNVASDLSGFLHLDFTPENNVRIDDNESTRFGHFERDQPFVVQVTLTIAPNASSAHILLSGAGGSGDTTYTLPAPFNIRAQQFGAIRVWQGFPHVGGFDTTNVVVTKKQE